MSSSVSALRDDLKGSPDRFGYSWERFNELTPGQERQINLASNRRKEKVIAFLEQAGLRDAKSEWGNEISWPVIGTKLL